MILIADRQYHQGNVFDHSTQDMQQLATQTGGRVINVGNNGQKSSKPPSTRFRTRLRTQYLVSYTPANKTADGKFRKINIDCGKGAQVQARKGYYAIAGDAAND